MPKWWETHPELIWWTAASSLLTVFASMVIVPLLLCLMPADYFVREDRSQGESWMDRHPVLRWTLRIAKNLLGTGFILLGLALLVLPGQGVLTILLGVALLDLPGKRGLEIALLRRPHVCRGINWLRERGQRPPLQLPDGVIES